MNFQLDVLVPQLARPQGWFGQVIATMLNRGNRDINMHVIGALELMPFDRVLETGFGGGIGLATALRHEPKAAFSGLELSQDMVDRCRKRFGDTVRLVQGSVDALPFEDGSFDKVYGVNVTYFWPDLDAALAELRRVLRPGGTLVFGIRPPETLRRFRFDVAGHRVWSGAQYAEALTTAGFCAARARRMPDPNDGTFVVTAQRH